MTQQNPSLMKGKKGLIFGIANDHSIAWGIAKKLHEHGSELAITYQNENFLRRIKPLANSLECETLIPCDVEDENQIKNCFEEIKKQWSKIDFIVHAIAYSDKNELKGRYIDTSRQNFANTLNTSCFSFTEITRYAYPLIKKNGSILTLSFEGARRVMPSY
ncbi:MAG: SDR family oxidoreductase, partial [Pseudomonadota bacterium]